MTEEQLKKAIEEKRNNLIVELTEHFGKEPQTIKLLNKIVDNCELRIKRHIKAFSYLQVYNKVYNKYYDVLYDMSKIDYQYLGSEGEVSREVEGLRSEFGMIRPSDEILSRIPQGL